ncbi:hypothetical protein G9C98_001246 [Cotesia typhae]|uniref:Uncharacterized protein n=1 Tax=Cotesia typhae TaxID=2053667 RepID=A0A8J5QV99_9HYME|nr:hypothetical protein G9C98_001246 [Cotesia typhae]
MNFIKNIIFISTIAVVLSVAKTSKNDVSHIFVQQLKPHICYKNDVCDLSTINSWYIEEFKSWVQNQTYLCRNNYDQFHKDISPISETLTKKWGLEGYTRPGPIENLHLKWRNDGICVDELEYFYKSLELFDKYNMNQILRENNIFPNNNYTAQEISDAVSKGLGDKKPKVECFDYNGDMQLQKITLYFDKSFELIDSVRSFANCEPDTILLYRDHIKKEYEYSSSAFHLHISN